MGKFRSVSLRRCMCKFAGALRTRLLDRDSGFGKAYINLLVDEIRLDGSKLYIRGS